MCRKLKEFLAFLFVVLFLQGVSAQEQTSTINQVSELLKNSKQVLMDYERKMRDYEEKIQNMQSVINDLQMNSTEQLKNLQQTSQIAEETYTKQLNSLTEQLDSWKNFSNSQEKTVKRQKRLITVLSVILAVGWTLAIIFALMIYFWIRKKI